MASNSAVPTFTAPQLRRGWCKGSRLEFLQSHMSSYEEARRKGRAQAKERSDAIFVEFCKRYPYDLPLDKEPDSTDVHHSSDAVLTPYEEGRKAALLERLSTARILL
ncbi:hypothetical protein BDZ89DRAFT_1150374 [Hymenopellis radicata]|nr:hypothetical protein BDZ89DRAFT_1150374 [Hymenopellis radicata]